MFHLMSEVGNGSTNQKSFILRLYNDGFMAQDSSQALKTFLMPQWKIGPGGGMIFELTER